MTHIRFGTDGWRGRIAEDYTFDNVRRCAQGFARYLEAHGKGGAEVVVGYDRRFASRHFAIAAAEVMAANGYRVWLTEEATPTPVVSYSIVERKAAGGINITASHNPPWDNGFKVRDEHGAAVDPEGLREIEAVIPPIEEVRRVDFEEAQEQGRIRLWDPAPAYIAHISRLVDIRRIQGAGLHILVEPMWGNGIGWFPRLLEGGDMRVAEIHNIPNPLFPEMSRPEPIPPNVDAALRKTVELGADICLILDGDADRMGIGDENGQFVNQLQVYALLAYYLLEVRGERGPIVKTLSTTAMLDKLGQLYGVPVYQTGVGFKYVAPKMLETNAMIGGEESGGYAFRGHVPERDGILAGLYLLDFMVKTGKTPTQLIEYLYSKVGPHYYDRVDAALPVAQRDVYFRRVSAARPERIGGLAVKGIDTTDGFKYLLEDGGWMLIRFSGTEPLIRVYTETTQKERVKPILDDGLRIAGLKTDAG